MPDPAKPIEPIAPALAPVTAAPVAPAVVASPATDVALSAPASEQPVLPAAQPSATPAADVAGALSTPASEPSLLQQFDKDQKAKEAEAVEAAKAAEAAAADKKPEPAKPAEAPKVAEAKPGETPAPVADQAAPAPVEYKYTLPETLKLDDARKTEFHAALDSIRANPAEGVQPLIDLHNKAMTEYATALADNQQKVFNDFRAEQRKEVMADRQIGGSGYQTAMGAIARMRDLLVRKEFQEARKWPDGSARPSKLDEYLEYTGSGDNLVLLDILHNAARYFDEPPMPPGNARPTKTNGANRMTRLRDTYDHARSTNAGR